MLVGLMIMKDIFWVCGMFLVNFIILGIGILIEGI